MVFFNKKESAPQTSAAISDGCLVVSLPDAVEPKLWRLDLSKAKEATFEIKSNEEQYDIISKKSARSKADVIGTFDDKDDALNTLLIISDALKTGKSQTAKPATKAAKKEKEATPKKEKAQNDNTSSENRGVIALLSTIIVIGLFYFYWTQMLPSTNTFETQTILSSDPSAPQTGVPMSADDFLRDF